MIKKLLLLLIVAQCSFFLNGQLIADHTVVELYDDIPQQYIDSVKKMLVFMGGESHSGAYRSGPELLELLDTVYRVETYDGDPLPPYTDQHLRIGRPFMVGESSFFSQSGIDDLKSHITDQAGKGNPYDVMGFGWCWDMTSGDPPGGGLDTVFHVHWAGSSQGGPDGNRRWGLDGGDSILTGNRVCMDTYLQAVEQYITYCDTNSYPTRWVFTTGPVDEESCDGTEEGFQRELKHDYIRDYVRADPSRILFDYADILCWSDSGEQNLAVWQDGDSLRPHMQIHPDNMMDYDDSWNRVPFSDQDGDHIGEVGELRLAKAMWWMLARMAGWDGTVLVTGIQVIAGNMGIMTGDTLRFDAVVTPQVATDPRIAWSLLENSGSGSLSEDGLLLGLLPGTVTVVATALDGSGVADSLQILITPPEVPVTGIDVLPEDGVNELVTGDTLQFSAVVVPDSATNPLVRWSVVTGTGSATIADDGMLAAGTPGTVTVVAGALDGTGITDSFRLNIISPPVAVSSIELSSESGSVAVVSGDSLQFLADIFPEDATNKELEWSVIEESGSAGISQSGLLTAGDPGLVTVVATALDGSGVTDSLQIAILTFIVPLSGIEISSEGDADQVEEGNTLQLYAEVTPPDATIQLIRWIVLSPGTGVTGTGRINQYGLFSAEVAGDVVIRANAMDGSGVFADFSLTITQPAGVMSRERGDPLLWPNPGETHFYLDLSGLQVDELRVVSTGGGIVLSLAPVEGAEIVELDLSGHPAGLYMVLISSDRGTFTKKLILTK